MANKKFAEPIELTSTKKIQPNSTKQQMINSNSTDNIKNVVNPVGNEQKFSSSDNKKNNFYNSKKKIIIITVVVFLLIVIGIFTSYYIYIQNKTFNLDNQIVNTNINIGTQNDQGDSAFTDWKTYKNDELGIEFKYPNDFTVDIYQNFLERECPACQLQVVVLNDKHSFEEQLNFGFLLIGLYSDNIKNLDEIKSNMESQLLVFKDSYPSLPEISEFTIDNGIGFRYDLNSAGFSNNNMSGDITNILLLKDGIPYAISYGVMLDYPGDKYKIKSINEKIISTLKFNPQSSLSSIEDMQTEVERNNRDNQIKLEQKNQDNQIKANIQWITVDLSINYNQDNGYLNYIIPSDYIIPDCSDDDQYNINISEDGESYIIWADLCFEDGVFCADSSRFLGTIEGSINSSSFSCQ